MSGKPDYVSFIQFVKIDDSTAIVLHTHALPKDEGRATASYGWLDDRHMQELMVLVHDVVYSRATNNLASTNRDPSTAKPHYEFRRGKNLRALLTFKTHGYREHLVLPTHVQLASPTPVATCVAFTNEYGRRVIPYLNSITAEGSGYRAFQLLPEAVHAFVDPHELTSALGVFKILTQLDPTHTRSLDIASYFQLCKDQTQGRRDRGGGEEQEEGGEGELLPQVPVAGLKKSLSRRGKKKTGMGKPSRQQGWRMTRATAKKLVGQPTITASITNVHPLTGLGPRESPTRGDEAKVAELSEENLPSEFIDEFFDFESQRTEANGSLSPKPPEEEAEGCWLNDSSEDLFADDHAADVKEDEEEEGKRERNREEERLGGGGYGAAIGLSISQGDIDSALFDIQTPSPQWLKPQRSFVLTDMTNTTVDGEVRSPGHSTRTVAYPSTRSASREALSQVLGYDSPLSPNVGGTCPSQEASETCGSPDCMRTVVYPTPESLRMGRLATSSICSAEAENDIIMISSGEEEEEEEEESVKGSQSQSREEGRKDTRRTKKKAKNINLKKLFEGKDEIRELSRLQVHKWLRSQKDVIVSVFLGNTYSRRHSDFMAGAKKKASLRHQLHTGLFRKDQLDVITRGLLQMFCAKNMKFFDYAMSVLYPECLVRLIMEFYHVDFETAEQIMVTYGENVDQVEIS